jgi:hypothetical protein
VVLFGDEVSFAMWGSLARTWAPIGQQPTVKTTGIRKGLKMFGTIELKGGSFQYQQSLAYVLKPKSLKLLKEAKLPTELLALLKTLKNEQYATQMHFLAALNTIADSQLITKYQSVILQHTETSGRFNGESYIEFLKQLLSFYKGKIILIEDGAPYSYPEKFCPPCSCLCLKNNARLDLIKSTDFMIAFIFLSHHCLQRLCTLRHFS